MPDETRYFRMTRTRDGTRVTEAQAGDPGAFPVSSHCFVVHYPPMPEGVVREWWNGSRWEPVPTTEPDGCSTPTAVLGGEK
jgi:hypothetical protein